jgi:hypothetical protein
MNAQQVAFDHETHLLHRFGCPQPCKQAHLSCGLGETLSFPSMRVPSSDGLRRHGHKRKRS